MKLSWFTKGRTSAWRRPGAGPPDGRLAREDASVRLRSAVPPQPSQLLSRYPDNLRANDHAR